MKKIAALIGLLASVLLIGICVAQDDTEGAGVEPAADSICGDIVEQSIVASMDEVAGDDEKGHPPPIEDLCGQTLVRSPGSVLKFCGPEPIMGGTREHPKVLTSYLWTVMDGKQQVYSGDDKCMEFTVPKDACLAKYTICLTVGVIDEKIRGCKDSCEMTVLIDCECPPLNENFCLGEKTGPNAPRAILYNWEGRGVAVWEIAGQKYNNPKLFDWTKKGVGEYSVCLKVYDKDCRCGMEHPVKMCCGKVKIVASPDAIITEVGPHH
jgi:hypothetical protein